MLVRRMWRAATLAVVLFCALTGVASATPEAPVLAKYYAWFDENSWAPGMNSDQPTQPYRSADRATIERHVAQAQAAGIDGFELNWWGPDNPTDTNLQTLLEVAKKRNFKVTVDFDLNSPFINSPSETVEALNYLRRYYADPAWFSIDGKPVVSFYGIRKFDVDTWFAIHAASGATGTIWIGEGDRFGYLQIFDGMHPYSVAWSGNPSAQLASYASRTRAIPGTYWVATVMPGYDDTRLGRSNGFSVDRGNGDYYRSMWYGAIATRPAFIVITSWNEWPEGSQIEPSKSYGDYFLQITRDMAGIFSASRAG